ARAAGEEVQARRPRLAEEGLELAVEGARRRVVEGEVVHVEPEAPIRRDVNELPDLFDVARTPVGRHAHYLVLALVHLEAQESGERAVEQPERVREAQLPLDGDRRPLTERGRGGRP